MWRPSFVINNVGGVFIGGRVGVQHNTFEITVGEETNVPFTTSVINSVDWTRPSVVDNTARHEPVIHHTKMYDNRPN